MRSDQVKNRVNWLLITAFLLVMSVATIASAAIQASQYIATYGGGVTSPADNKVQISFNITATGTMDMVGVKTIILQERSSLTDDWSVAKTYSYSDYANMMKENAIMVDSSVTYTNAIGDYYYRAKIYFYAENGGYDTRELITYSVQAKP